MLRNDRKSGVMSAKTVAMAGTLVLGLGVVAACSSSASDDASSASASTPATGLTAYITDAADNGDSPGVGTVIPVNLGDQTPGTPIELGQGAGTNDIIVTSDQTTAYVTNEGTNSVSSIDLASGEVGTPITIGDEPVDIKFVPNTDEQVAWTANYGGQTVSIVNLGTGELVQTFDTPFAGPNTVAFTPDGKTCYVANWGTNDVAGDTVTPILVKDGGASGEILPPIKVGLHPNWVAITPDGVTAYVANKGSNSITPIDVATNTAGEAIAVPGPPIQMEIAPDGTFAYVAIAGSEPQMDEVVPIDLTTSPATVGAAIKLTPQAQPHWIAFTPDGTTAYVVGNGNSTLTPITVATGTAGTPIQVLTDKESDLLAISITSTG